MRYYKYLARQTEHIVPPAASICGLERKRNKQSVSKVFQAVSPLLFFGRPLSDGRSGGEIPQIAVVMRPSYPQILSRHLQIVDRSCRYSGHVA